MEADLRGHSSLVSDETPRVALDTATPQAPQSGSQAPENSKRDLSSDEAGAIDNGRRVYDRETLLRVRRSPVVLNAVIELESEIQRDLMLEPQGGILINHLHDRASDTAGSQEGSFRREDGWRHAAQNKRPLGISNATSPPYPSAPRSLLIDEVGSSASPERPALLPHRPGGPNWRRPGGGDVRNDIEEDDSRRSLGRGMGREDGDRERKASISAGADDVWRPAGPPGLARGAAQRIAPPGLGAPGNNTHERPWGSGRGRLGDGERRVTGKPRDPPGVMPPREQSRDPQLPEGWNRTHERSAASDWRAGKGEVVLRPTGKDEHYNHRAERSTESKSDPPAWLNADDAQEFEALSESADSRRQEFEAEHKKLRSEREAARAAGSGAEEISLDEIEAMKQEALVLDSTAPHSQRPSRPHSATGFETLIGEHLSQGSTLKDSGESRDEASSRFSRFFQMEPSQSASQLPDLPPNPSPVLPPAKQASMPLPGASTQTSQSLGPEVHQLQAYLHSRAPSATGSASELPVPQRNLLAHLQAQGSGNLTQTVQQSAEQSATANQARSQLDRYFRLEKSLLSPRSEQGLPGGGLPRPALQQQLSQGANSNNALISLLQGQQGLTPQDSVASQLSGSIEPTFANPNPSQQQQQNLLNALNLGNQPQGGAAFNNNLLEHLQRMKLASDQQQKQQQLQQQFQLQQNAQGPAQTNANLLAAFSAHMPRDVGAPKQLSDDIFSFNPTPQLHRISQAALHQPTSLGLGKNERLGTPGAQTNASLSQLIQGQQINPSRGLGQQAPPNLTNGLYNLPQAGTPHLATLRDLTVQGVNKFPQYQQSQPGTMGQGSQSLGAADPQQIARYLQQARQTHVLQQLQQQQQQHAQQTRLMNTQRLYQMQMQAAQQQAAQAALLQQQQQQSRLSNEALVRQQQLIQLQNLQALQQLGSGAQGNSNLLNSASDPNVLARLFANTGTGLNNLPGRGQ